MARFTISRHTGSREGDHYDVMVQHGEALRTWRVREPYFGTPQTATLIADHRAIYLDFEGEIEGGRGVLRIWDTGVYSIDEWTSSRIRLALVGRRLRTRLLLQRSDLPTRPTWTLVDATVALREAAAAFQGLPLDDAPTPEWSNLGTALSNEGRRVLAWVDQYIQGGPVDWSLTPTDPQLRPRIAREAAYRDHPWLTRAADYARRLEELACQLSRQRPH